MNDAIDIESLLVHSAFLRGLAKSLTGDEHLAEDVVQETWLAAAAGGPREPERTRSWLAAVVRNLAIKRIRGDARRRGREREAAQAEPVAPTDEIVRREAVRRRVVEAVLALEEPFRSAVVFRYLEERPPREIARITGVSANTVRSRLRLARDKLRARLDELHDGDRRAWALPLLGWLRRTRAPTGPAIFAGAMGGVLMSAKAKLLAAAAALLLLAGGAAIWFESPEGGGAPAPAPAEVATAPAPDDPAAADASSDPATADATAPARRGTAAVEGKLARWDGSVVPEGIEVTLVAADGSRFAAATAPGGAFRIDGLPAGAYRLLASVEGCGPVVVPEFRLGDGEQVRLPFPPTLGPRAPLRVRVIGPDGRPIPGATVGALSLAADAFWSSRDDGGPVPPAAFAVTTGADGVAGFADLSAGDWRLVTAAPGLATDLRAVTLPEDGAETTVDVRLSPACELRGRVLDGVGRPVADAVVRIGPAGDGGVDPRAHPCPGTRRAKTGADGGFTLPALPPGTWLLAARTPAGDETAPVTVRVPAVDLIDLVVSALPRGEITGRILEGESGDPVAGVRLTAGGAEALSGADGRYRLVGVPAGTARVTIFAPAWRTPMPPVRTIRLEAGATAAVDFFLSRGGGVAGRVTGPDGPVAGATVVATAASGPPVGGRAASDSDGRYEITGLAAGSYRLAATARGYWQDRSDGSVEVPETGLAPHDLRLNAADAAIRGRVVDGEGRPVAGVRIQPGWSRDFAPPPAATTAPDGTFAIRGAVPGASLRVWLQKEDWATEETFVELSPDTGSPVTLVMRPRPRVRGVVRGTAGEPVAGASVEARAGATAGRSAPASTATTSAEAATTWRSPRSPVPSLSGRRRRGAAPRSDIASRWKRDARTTRSTFRCRMRTRSPAGSSSRTGGRGSPARSCTPADGSNATAG